MNRPRWSKDQPPKKKEIHLCRRHHRHSSTLRMRPFKDALKEFAQRLIESWVRVNP